MRMAIIAIGLGAVSAAYAQKDWPTAGHDLAGTRYSTLKQIDAKNVTKLERVWTYHMNADAPPPGATAPAAGSSDAGDAVAGLRAAEDAGAAADRVGAAALEARVDSAETLRRFRLLSTA